jgi:Zn finger protein HypA/HybF involved in hydrogenase expression
MTTLTIFPAEFPLKEDQVFSEASQLMMNIRPREVYCPKCKYRAITNLASPKCVTCKNDLITLLINSSVA